jgi:hypothetical protein
VPDAQPDEVGEQRSTRFAHEALHGLAVLGPEDHAAGNLSLPLGLSLWMRRGGLDVHGARHALLGLRAALLDAAGLDARTEPIPLQVADPVAAAISVAVYVDGLLTRAAGSVGTTRVDMAERAVGLMST